MIPSDIPDTQEAAVPDATHPLYILAMDHRDSLAKQVYGIDGEPTPAQSALISDGKMLVLEGATAALSDLPPAGRAGILVDERYGAAVAREARQRGFALIMPIERSGRPFFELEFGAFETSEWLDHIEEFDPDYAKILVRDNPEFDVRDRRTQQDHLAAVSRSLKESGRKLIIELLVPPTAAQSATQADDYDRAVRPLLTERLIREFHWAGVEPDIWKLEGFETADASSSVALAARDDNRSSVRCIVLGRDSSEPRLDHWLTVAAPIPGFAGFAIGRSIWEQPLKDELAGTIDTGAFIDAVAATFTHYANTYDSADRRG